MKCENVRTGQLLVIPKCFDNGILVNMYHKINFQWYHTILSNLGAAVGGGEEAAKGFIRLTCVSRYRQP